MCVCVCWPPLREGSSKGRLDAKANVSNQSAKLSFLFWFRLIFSNELPNAQWLLSSITFCFWLLNRQSSSCGGTKAVALLFAFGMIRSESDVRMGWVVEFDVIEIEMTLDDEGCIKTVCSRGADGRMDFGRSDICTHHPSSSHLSTHDTTGISS